MAKQLDDTPVKMGTFIPVENQNPHRLAAKKYLALKVEDEDGKNERWLLLTQGEVKSVRVRVSPGLTSVLKAGRLYEIPLPKNLNLNTKTQYLVRLDGLLTDGIYVVSSSFLAQGEERAKKNPEDVPKQGWLSDLKD